MGAFLIRRLAALTVTLLLASVTVFAVTNVLPGDPALVMLGTEARADTLAALRAELGIDRPLLVRYVDWVAGLISGDLGISYTYRVPVAELVLQRMAVTAPLALMAMGLAVLIALPLGILAAHRHRRFGDYGVMAFAQIGIAVPNFWFGILLILLVSVQLGWSRAGGFPGWEAGPQAALGALLLPAVALALTEAAILARVTRAAMLETLREDYVRTARAKGVSRAGILWRHALRNALIPVLTIGGLIFAFLLTGALVIENVFYLPGVGRLIFQAVAQRDLIVVQSVVMVLVTLVAAVNSGVDVLAALADPRPKARA